VYARNKSGRDEAAPRPADLERRDGVSKARAQLRREAKIKGSGSENWVVCLFFSTSNPNHTSRLIFNMT
jgi:hypothetical protein